MFLDLFAANLHCPRIAFEPFRSSARSMSAPTTPAKMQHRSVQRALERGSDLWGQEEAPLGTVNSVEDIWTWLQGPVLDVIFTDRNAR